uniref:G_PROTEIN_RECEP_F1_2 domain-containing protein n=1 Tax=Bursaphelenchus xylophilus TaxID=6326 RepID=A0A1I7S8A4_BURXY
MGFSDGYMNVLYVAIAGFGIFGNANIIWVSIRKPSLRGNCHIFIAVTALGDIFHQSAHFISAYYKFKFGGSVAQIQCFYSMCVPLYGALLTPCMLLFISLDRLICILKPLAYSSIGGRKYMFVILALVFIFPLPTSIVGYISVQNYLYDDVPCLIINGYVDEGTTLFLGLSSLLNVLTVLPYAIIRIRAGDKKFAQNRQILKSVAIVSIVMCAACVITNLNGTIWKLFVERIPEMATLLPGLAVNLSIAMNYPIYFFVNKNYRRAFQEQFFILLPCLWPFKGVIKSVDYTPSMIVTSSKI